MSEEEDFVLVKRTHSEAFEEESEERAETETFASNESAVAVAAQVPAIPKRGPLLFTSKTGKHL